MDNIEDQLYENSETISKEINQLKRTVSNLEKKFDKVLEAIAMLDKKIAKKQVHLNYSSTNTTMSQAPC